MQPRALTRWNGAGADAKTRRVVETKADRSAPVGNRRSRTGDPPGQSAIEYRG
ncbi:hypothetical protein [Natrarchaeobius oligotrophus]|uniref:hypothetical protein n=1 Tax=Natrarchaeobius oligotrophus TaxID=3455743 RepID=UPI0014051C27|nr:hypothetical protein [Natrarchaeobius chitinivorans]